MVMGDGSCSRGCEFESRHQLQWMDIFSQKFVGLGIVCLKGPKINEKEAGNGPIF